MSSLIGNALIGIALASMAARPWAPTDLPALTASFLEGDLVTLERGRALVAADRGALGLLGDLSRLVRCLPLGPIPTGESDRYRGPRLLVRLERIRLEQLARDSMHRGTALEALLLRPPLYRSVPADQSALFVRWPVEPEVWPGEVTDKTPAQPECAKTPGERRERGAAHDTNKRLRDQAERAAVTSLLRELEHLPDQAAGRIALAYLAAAEAAGDRFAIPSEWMDPLVAAVTRAVPPERSAARMVLARSFEKNGAVAPAAEHYRALLADRSRTADEESRTRARLAALLEPDWDEVLAAAETDAPRAVDRAALANARARALFALGRREELMTFGRRWLRERTDEPFDRETADLLLRLGLQLPAAQAMAWVREISPADEKAQRSAMAMLADLAVAENRHELAIAIYDQLRLEAAAARERMGPRAAKLQARWLRARAIVEFEKRDVAAFAGFVDDILALAAVEEDRPLARYAPHREVAQLCQDLMGRLTNEAATDPERRKFAALLLEAVTGLLAKSGGRNRDQLARWTPPLTALAGDYAHGRTARIATKERRVRQLGEVVIPRLPPRITPPDHPTPLPAVDSFLVYERPDGSMVAGAPWSALLAKRKK